MLEKIEIVKPMEIEKRSMEIITRELGGRTWPEPEFSVIKRCIHTSADFDYADNLCFSEHAVQKGIDALKRRSLHCHRHENGGFRHQQKAHGGMRRGSLLLYVRSGRGRNRKRERAVPGRRSAWRKAAALSGPLIIAVGNAPTALIRLYELIQEGKIAPALIIGAPVGFVNVVEAKELIMTAGVPYIVPRGRKGGSNIAAAICNAMLYQGGR